MTLKRVQESLQPATLLLEYVLARPHSYALAITRTTVDSVQLAAKNVIETDAKKYRASILAQRANTALSERLFDELLGPVHQYSKYSELVIVPDGALDLLPFAALSTHGSYILTTHSISVSPSATVSALLERRRSPGHNLKMPYIGVAAWTQTRDTRNFILRDITGPEQSQFIPLPDSRREVETIARDLPKPSTVLLGAAATETRFKALPLDSTDVIHLALHGYANLDYPDRSALIFAPSPSGKDDGLLQVREIRGLHIGARLVTLSACDTGVGPVGVTGVQNIVNAFIDAGAESVVSTLWGLEDHSTERLMTDFYGQLAAHKPKAEALRDAQLDLVKQGLPPYFWASFQMVGDPNGIL